MLPLVKLQSGQRSTLLISLLNMVNWVFKWVSLFPNCWVSQFHSQLSTCDSLFSRYHLKLRSRLMHTCDFPHMVFSRNLLYAHLICCLSMQLCHQIAFVCRVQIATARCRSFTDLCFVSDMVTREDPRVALWMDQPLLPVWVLLFVLFLILS